MIFFHLSLGVPDPNSVTITKACGNRIFAPYTKPFLAPLIIDKIAWFAGSNKDCVSAKRRSDMMLAKATQTQVILPHFQFLPTPPVEFDLNFCPGPRVNSIYAAPRPASVSLLSTHTHIHEQRHSVSTKGGILFRPKNTWVICTCR